MLDGVGHFPPREAPENSRRNYLTFARPANGVSEREPQICAGSNQFATKQKGI
jgi:hypothetical protein